MLDEIDVIFHGATNATETLLFWELRSWPADLYAFRIKANSNAGAEATESWKSLHDGDLRPSYIADKDWSRFGIPAARVDAIVAAGRDMDFPVLDKDQTLNRYHRQNGPSIGERIFMKMSFDRILFSGFGLIDPVGEAEAGQTYGLFAVDMAGRESAAPIATYTREARGIVRYVVDPEVRLNNATLVLGWSLPGDSYRRLGLTGFHIDLQAIEGSEPAQRLTRNALGPIASADDRDQWLFEYGLADTSQDYVITFTAVDVFSREREASKVIFEAEKFRPVVPATVSQIAMEGTAAVKLGWTLDEADAERTAGFVVEILRDGRWQGVSEILPNDARSYIDDSDKETGSVYLYRVGTIDTFDKIAFSDPQSIFYAGFERPPPPRNFVLTRETRDGKDVVKMNWGQPLPDDALTDSFIIFSDETEEGDLIHQGGITPLEKSLYFYELSTLGGRSLTLGVAAISVDGVRSETVSERIYIPLRELPRPTEFRVAFDREDYAADFTWTYAEQLESSLQGFRLTMDGAIVAGPIELPPHARAFSLDHHAFAKGYRGAFTLQAVGVDLDSPATARQSLWIRTERPVEGLEAPTSLAGEFEETEEGRFIALSWDEVDFEEAGIVGYVLFADYAREGRVRRLGSIALIPGNTFRYPLPETRQEGRKSYTLAVAPLTAETFQVGPKASVTVNLPEPEPEGAAPTFGPQLPSQTQIENDPAAAESASAS